MTNVHEIVEWIKKYENSLDNLEAFVKGLQGEILRLDFVATNGGNAI